MLFVLHDAGDALHALHHLGIGGPHQLGDEAGELVEERLLARRSGGRCAWRGA